MVRSSGAIKKEAYAAAITSKTAAAQSTTRFAIPAYSSSKYSPKSHSAVKNTTSNTARKPIPFHCITGSADISPTVTSVLATRIGASNGSRSSGSSSSRIRACAEIAASAVPAVEIPRLPRKNVNKIPSNCPRKFTLKSTANTGSIKSSVSSRNKVFAAILARKIANGSFTASRSALKVSFACSRRKQGCNINDAANRNASHSSPGPKRCDSFVVGSNVKLNSTTTISTNTIVVLSSSRERNSVRTSLPRSAAALESTRIEPYGARRKPRHFGFAMQTHDDGASTVTKCP